MEPTARRANWFLLAGKTGAGKSIVARQLGREQAAPVFTLDEWMSTLFWMDCPEKNDLPWALERIRRCEEQMLKVACGLASQGISSVFDLGFTRRQQRWWWLERAREAGVPAWLQVVEAPMEVRWERVRERNEGRGDTFAFGVTRGMFDLIEEMWEPVTAEEQAEFAAAASDSHESSDASAGAA